METLKLHFPIISTVSSFRHLCDLWESLQVLGADCIQLCLLFREQRRFLKLFTTNDVVSPSFALVSIMFDSLQSII